MVGNLLLTFAAPKLGVSWGVPLLCGHGEWVLEVSVLLLDG